jgi:hypothetical protein
MCDRLNKIIPYKIRSVHKMAKIRRLVLDTLKPHEPNIIDLANELGEITGVSAVNISIYELDRKVENAKITIEGEDISYESISL